MDSIAPMMTRRRTLQITDEGATKGVANAGLTHVYAFDVVMNPDDTFIQRKPSNHLAGNLDGVVGARTGTCTFRVELRRLAAATLNAGVDLLLAASGWKLATATYTPSIVESNQATLTIDLNEDGLLKRMTGCMGNVRIVAEVGGIVYLECEFKGIWVAPIDADLGSATAATVVPMRFASSTLALGAYTPKIMNFALSLNANVILRPDQSTAAGYLHALITDIDPTIELDLEADNVATHDAYGIWLAGTNANLSMTLADATAKSTIAGAIQYRSIAEGDRDGVVTHNVVAQFVNKDDGSLPTITTAAP